MMLPTSTAPVRASSFWHGVLIELVGACLLLFTSRYASLDWIPALGNGVGSEPGLGSSWLPFTLLVAALLTMLVGYLIGLRARNWTGSSPAPGLAPILLAAAIVAFPLLLLITMPYSDIYSYAIYGRIEAIYGANPYTDPPADFIHDPLLPLLGDQSVVSVYGPVWQAVARLLALAAGPAASPALHVLLYKLLGLATLLLGAALIWTILGRLAPTEQGRATWFYAANPLCLLELVGSGHNDGFMIALLLLGLLAQLRGRTTLALICFGLAVFTKWVVLLLVPAYLVWAWRAPGLRLRAARDLLASTAIVLALVAVLYGSNWAGWRTLQAVTGGAAATTLRYSLAAWTASTLAPDPEARNPGRVDAESGFRRPRAPAKALFLTSVERRAKWSFVLLFAAWALALLPSVRRMRDLPRVWGWTLFAYVCLASTWFWPWYVVWVLALAALGLGTPLARSAFVLSVTALGLTVARAAEAQLGYTLPALPLYVFLPPLLYAALEFGRARRRLAAPPAALGPVLWRK